MIHLDQPTTTVRRLLRQLRRPHLLARDPLAMRLRDLLKTENCRDALILLIDRTFANDVGGERLREILARCDLHAQKSRSAAASMHLSLRQFFRCRAEAITALALAIEQLDTASPAGAASNSAVYCSMCYKRIVTNGSVRSRLFGF